ncbi:hypothetical protein RV03_GL000434 [Enterococcus gallinarum]|nr:hypothetical protein RV03_GL000434 [Enterococcus gallinarum]
MEVSKAEIEAIQKKGAIPLNRSTEGVAKRRGEERRSNQ